MYRCVRVCVCVKTRIFIVKDNSQKRARSTRTYIYVYVRGMCDSGMSKSLNLFVIQAHCWCVNLFECI